MAKKSEKTVDELVAERDKLLQKASSLNGEIHKAQRKDQQVDPAAIAEEARQARKRKYETWNGLTIHKLRKAGHKVSVTHIRYVSRSLTKESTGESTVFLLPVTCSLRKFVARDFFPKGGQTWVQIKTTDDKDIVVDATCNMEDHYDYKMGVKTCLECIPKATADKLLLPLAEEVVAAATAE